MLLSALILRTSILVKFSVHGISGGIKRTVPVNSLNSKR
jgi:hypothetical protein